MGGSESKNDYVNDITCFTDEEKDRIHGIFANISSHDHKIDKNLLQVFCEHSFEGELIEYFYDWMQSLTNNKNHTLTYAQFLRCMSIALRGNVTEKSQLIVFISSKGRKCTTGEEIVQFVKDVIKSFLKTITQSIEVKSWNLESTEESIYRLAVYMLDDLFFTGKEKDRGMTVPVIPTISYTEEDIDQWLSKSYLFLHVIDRVLNHCFTIYSEEEMRSRNVKPRIPLIKNINWTKLKSLLDYPTLIYLNSNLPADLQREWRLLFSNYLYGDSFVQLVGRILSQGPTVVMVKDKNGHVFGGFASENWKKNSNFYGDGKCFLFQLKPFLSTYTPTGYNNHFQYFNQHVHTLPNGLGFGGQLEYFGLWIDQSFSNGHSKAGPRCTTYGSPQLSKAAEFEVDTIEVWGVGPEPNIDDEDFEGMTEEEIKSRRSILDKDPGAKAMLTLIGKTPHSEGLREGDELANSPEETTSTVISLF
ncbi:hypothetical protein LOTGIDRAFT_229816 [Lottia gigantea]|uniref:MTOR-associated protein MEAK7 n=1 Tax=Lottia gigantea TaxID=225164 RepID=V4B2P3_LOTGI|nr:hypothetical protein LOTGIDRAFT_229816 [Lottia gigantea]ESO82794.1 hypothetical protein LOTGIDRAFT_229816 [Lottia gigantea]